MGYFRGVPRKEGVDYGCLVRCSIRILLTVLRTLHLSVPVSNLPLLIKQAKQDIDGLGLTAYTILGHVGDGKYPHFIPGPHF